MSRHSAGGVGFHYRRNNGSLTAVDLFVAIRACITSLAGIPHRLPLVLLSATIAAITIWALFPYWAHLWNTRYRLRLWQHVMRIVASIAVACGVIAAAALTQLETVMSDLITMWSAVLTADSRWNAAVFDTSYRQVEQSSLENLSSFPIEGRTIPVSTDSTKRLVADVYALAVMQRFVDERPFLGWALDVRSGVAQERIAGDMASYFAQHEAATYGLNRAGAIALAVLHDEVRLRIHAWLLRMRALVAAWIAGWIMFPAGLVAVGAYRNIDRR